jgi:hypothetical protein
MWKRLCGVAVIVAVSGEAHAKPKFQLDPTEKRVVLISDLYADPTCNPRQFQGAVVKRLFDDDHVTVAGFILELPDGSRDFINVDVDLKGLSLNASGRIIGGLKTLLTQGHVVDITAKFCASGHIPNLDAVREVPPWDH